MFQSLAGVIITHALSTINAVAAYLKFQSLAGVIITHAEGRSHSSSEAQCFNPSRESSSLTRLVPEPTLRALPSFNPSRESSSLTPL